MDDIGMPVFTEIPLAVRNIATALFYFEAWSISW